MKNIQKAYDAIFKNEKIDDLVFEGRNINYGAYVLRKDYDNRLILSLLSVIIFASFVVTFFYIRSLFIEKTIIVEESGPIVEFNPTTFEEKPDLVLPKEIIQPSNNILRICEFAAPLVVDDANTENTDFLGSGLLSDEALSDETYGYGVEPIIETGGNPIDTTGFTKWQVNEQATFMGGTEEKFRLWLSKHITYPENAVQYDIKGTVVLKFAVGKDGEVCSVSVEKGIHPVINEAAAKAVLDSPQWTPAKIDGNPVKVFYYLPIAFDLRN